MKAYTKVVMSHLCQVSGARSQMYMKIIVIKYANIEHIPV